MAHLLRWRGLHSRRGARRNPSLNSRIKLASRSLGDHRWSVLSANVAAKPTGGQEQIRGAIGDVGLEIGPRFLIAAHQFSGFHHPLYPHGPETAPGGDVRAQHIPAVIAKASAHKLDPAIEAGIAASAVAAVEHTPAQQVSHD